MIKAYFDVNGNPMFDVTARCIYQSDGASTWNKFYRAVTDSYDTMKKKDGASVSSYTPYATNNLGVLLNYSLADA